MKQSARQTFTKMNWKEQAERIIAQESEKKRIAQQQSEDFERRMKEQDKAILARLGVSKKLTDIGRQVWQAGRVEYVEYKGGPPALGYKPQGSPTILGYRLQAFYPVEVHRYVHSVYGEDLEGGGRELIKRVSTDLFYATRAIAQLGVFIVREWASIKYTPYPEYPASHNLEGEKSDGSLYCLTPDTKTEDLDKFLLADCVLRVSTQKIPGEYLRRYGGWRLSSEEACKRVYLGH